MIDQQLPPVPSAWPRTPGEVASRRRRTLLVCLGAVVGGAPVLWLLSRAASWLVVDVVAAAVLVAGLSHGSAPAGADGASAGTSHGPRGAHASPAPSPAPSPGPGPGPGGRILATAPALPVASRDAQGALAFSDYYVQAFAHGYATGDLAPLEAAQTPGCVTCAGIASALRSREEQGVPLRDPELTSVMTTVTGEDGGALVHTTVDVAASVVVLRDGTRVDLEGYRAETDEHLVWSGGRWRVADLQGDAWFVHLTHRTAARPGT
ncbi:DUF6318 family protein [Quadrisphaera oryzae]|uniref:DUF6318 family protein n=1 Tax=Quadrisphaera TaxID=317661 RepID=UPI0016455FF4|nr:DUF6318 family protein [Quadrisphaera sp. RL12-1S]MBC3760846.1 hypothetical protein [Quadrisphaera sp. RL12-1S]